MSLPKLTESSVRAGASSQSFERGQEYYDNGAISGASIQGDLLSGECEGTSAPYYQVCVTLDEGGIVSADCTCPYEYGGYCKHIVALLLTYIHHPKEFAIREEPADLLADLDRDDLVALITRLLRDRPELYDWVEAALAVPTKSGKSPRKRRKKVDVEIYRRQIRNVMHSLDGMRMSEAYWHVGGLADELRGVLTTARKFLEAGDTETALEILLTLADEAGHGIEYIDDSNGELGGFMADLGLPLAEVILSLDLNAVAREKLRQRMEKLAAPLRDYGLEEGVAIGLQALDETTSDRPVRAARSTRAGHADDEDEDADEYDAEEDWDEVYGDDEEEAWSYADGDTLTTAKLNVLERQGRIDDYLALCLSAGQHVRYALKLCELDRIPEAVTHAKKHLASAEDARQLAERLREQKHIAEALAIGERGLRLKGSKAQLGQWLGALEETQGRAKQALRAWLAALADNPSLDTYKTVKRLAGSGWKRLRPTVMKLLDKSYEKTPLAEVLLFEQDWDAAIEVAERRNVGYTVPELVADAVIKHRPEWVAKISLKHAERLMTEVKSQNYPLAANWLKKAKKAYKQLSQLQEWQTYLDKTKEKYKRRPALQKQLRQL